MNQTQYFEECLRRIALYRERVAGKLESGQPRELVGSLADLAELGEVSRRLYAAVEVQIRAERVRE